MPGRGSTGTELLVREWADGPAPLVLTAARHAAWRILLCRDGEDLELAGVLAIVIEFGSGLVLVLVGPLLRRLDWHDTIIVEQGWQRLRIRVAIGASIAEVEILYTRVLSRRSAYR